MSASIRSPLARLVLFMVCLAVAGSLVAGVHYYAVDLPAQQNAVPLNSQNSAACMKLCQDDRTLCCVFCIFNCYHCIDEYNACTARC